MCDDCMEDCCCDGCDCCTCIPRNYRWLMIPIGIVIGIGLFLTVVLVPLSIKRVDFDEVAIQYDKVSRSYGDEILREGLHDIGPAGQLLVFKRTQRQGIIRDMTTLTSDGLEVYLTIDVLYSILTSDNDVKSILDLYYDQGGHDSYVIAMAETVVRDVISLFTARDFFEQRQEVQKQMTNLLSIRFVNGSAHADVEAVQLSNVDFSTAVSNALEYSTIIEQDIANAEAERATVVNAAENRRTLASLESDLTLLEANKNVNIRSNEAEATRKATEAGLTARTDAFVNISTSFGNGGDFFVYEYLRYLLLRFNEGKTIVGLDTN